jgi:indole-3-glycerol phosphate synthase
MSNVLATICTDRRADVKRRQTHTSVATLDSLARGQAPPRDFVGALQRSVLASGYGLITELKRASPSKGLIRADFDPIALARAYAAGGASCLSVLTEPLYFQGADDHLIAARSAVTLPVLRKDFILETYQVVESRAIGADCILLIMAALDDSSAAELFAAARELGMSVLVEVHNASELARAAKLEPELVGINNRDLATLTVDLATTEVLAPLVSARSLVVSESGLASPADLARMAAVGVRCFLIGESLMRQDDVTKATRMLLQVER